MQEEIQSGDALDKALLDPLPFTVGNHSRHQIEGKNPLRPLIVVINREGNAATHEGEIDRCLLATVLSGIDGLKTIRYFLVVGAHCATLGEHFVKEVFGLVMIEEHGGRREVKSYCLKVELGIGERVKGDLTGRALLSDQ
jgi:hypothetical protein